MTLQDIQELQENVTAMRSEPSPLEAARAELAACEGDRQKFLRLLKQLQVRCLSSACPLTGTGRPWLSGILEPCSDSATCQLSPAHFDPFKLRNRVSRNAQARLRSAQGPSCVTFIERGDAGC